MFINFNKKTLAERKKEAEIEKKYAETKKTLAEANKIDAETEKIKTETALKTLKAQMEIIEEKRQENIEEKKGVLVQALTQLKSEGGIFAIDIEALEKLLGEKPKK